MPDPTYTIDQLAEAASGFFGVDSPDIRGAFYGRTGAYTVSQAASILTAWLGAAPPGPTGGGGQVLLTTTADPDPVASAYPDGTLWARVPA